MDPQLLEDLSIYRDEDTLEIRAQDTRLWKNIGKNNAGELIIHVPDNLEGISTSLGTGTLYMCDIRTGELDISMGTGTADIQGFEAGEVSASAGTGSISLQGSVNSDLDLECGIGTIEFQDSGKMTDYNYSVSCGMGSIQIGDDELRSRQETRISTIMPEKKWTSSVVWEPSILHLRKESKNMEPKDYIVQEKQSIVWSVRRNRGIFQRGSGLIRLGMVCLSAPVLEPVFWHILLRQ